MRHVLAGLLLSLAVTGVPAAEVHLKDGSVIVGTILRLTDGEDLVVDTEYMDEVTIDWEGVASVRGTEIVDVELFDGTRYFGRMVMDEEGITIFDQGGGIIALDPSQLFAIDQFNQTWLDGLEAETDLGMNIVRGNNRVTQVSFGGSLSYDAKNFEASLDGTTIINEQIDLENTRRVTLGASYTQKFANDWSVSGLYSFEADEQQNLDGRSLFGAALGNRLMNSRRNRFRLNAGAVVNSERFEGEAGTVSLEGLLGFQYRRRAFADIDITFNLLPNLQDSDRIRTQLDGSLSFDLFRNLDFKVTVYDRFDSRPPEGNLERDTGLTLGVSWEY